MATIQYVVNAVDAASATFERIAGSADHLLKQLDDISGKSAIARVGLEGDKEAILSLDKLDLKMAKLAKSVAMGKIGVEGQARAILQIQALELEMDKLGAKHVTATVDVKVNRRGLGGLLSGAAESGLSPGGGGGGLGLLGPAAIGGGLIGAGLVPAAVGAGLGGAVGLGAIGGGLYGASQGKTTLAADLATISKTTTALKTAIGHQRTVLSQELVASQKKYAKDAAFFQPFTAFQASISHLMQTVLAPLRSIMGPLAGIFNQFGKGLTGLGPQFTALFRASLPFIRQFLQFMLQAGKILLPVFTQALQQMVKSGALTQITQALVVLTQGLAAFIRALGPGMKPSAELFARLATQTGRLMGFLGEAVTVVAKILTFDFPKAVSHGLHAVIASFEWWWRTLVHIFDTVRHAIALSLDALRHNIAVTFDRIRHDVAAVWDLIWRNTVTRVRNGITDVINWLKTLPGRAVAALRGLGHSLAAFATSAFTEMWNAIKNVAGNIWHWLTNWVSSLPGFLKKLLGIKSPSSVFYDIGKQMMMGLFHGIKDHVHHAANAAKAATSGFRDTGARSGSAAVAQAYAHSILPRGWSWPDLLALWNQESGWSAYAVNKSSGAYGIPQSLGHGHPYNLGDYKAQILWGLSYISQRYGSSQAAWAHEVSNNWYGSGLSGGIFSRPTLIGVGERGPERVDVTPVGGRRQGTGPLVVIEHLHVREAADVDLLARRLSFAMDA